MGKVVVVKPPEVFNPVDHPGSFISIFLGGSIDMGQAEDWQTKITSMLIEEDLDLNLVIYNPRRDVWDPTIEQTITNPIFYEQVRWEMDHLDICDIIVMYLDPKGKAPISLMEIGLHADDDKMIVCCPDGFWRKGNVEVVCQQKCIPLYNDFKGMYDLLVDELEALA